MTDPRYALSPVLAVQAVSEDVVATRSGSTVTRVEADGVAVLAAALIGELGGEGRSATAAELASALGVDGALLGPALARLVDAGVLVRHALGVGAAAVLAERRSGGQVPAVLAQERLDRDRVTILAAGAPVLAARLADALRLGGVGTTAHKGEEAAVVVVVGASPADEAFRERDDAARADGVPWLAVTPYDGTSAVVGPFVVPGSSACHECYRLRLSANLGDEVVGAELLRGRALVAPRPAVDAHPLGLAAAAAAATLVAEWIALRDFAPSAVPGSLTSLRLDDRGFAVDRQRVLRVPRCPSCSRARGLGLPQPWHHRDPVPAGGAS